jgi:hypothetical protein
MTDVYVVPRVAPCEHCGGGAVLAFKCSSCGGFQRSAYRRSRATAPERRERRARRARREACAHETETSLGVSYAGGAGTETFECEACGQRRYEAVD